MKTFTKRPHSIIISSRILMLLYWYLYAILHSGENKKFPSLTNAAVTIRVECFKD